MWLKTSLIGAGCLFTGLIVGRLSVDSPVLGDFSKGRNAKAELGEDGKITHEALSRSSGAVWRRTSGEMDTLEDLSGLFDPEKSGPLVVVPASLIEDTKALSGLRSLSHDLFSSNDSVEGMLQITDREKAMVQQAWRKMKKNLLSMESGQAKAEDLDDGSVRITVPDIGENYKAVANGFRWKVGETLGENRAEAFLALKQFDSMISTLKGEQVYLVEMDAVGDGQWRYRIQQKREDQPKRVIVTRNIPQNLRHLTDQVGIEPHLGALIEEPEY